MLSLRYDVHGAADALPVVFLPAFPYSREMWDVQTPALSGKRVVRLDVRGLGADDPSPRAFMLEHWVDDLLSTLKAADVQRCVLVGCSMGGYIALRAIARAPERISGLLLADTQAGADSNEAKIQRAKALSVLSSSGRDAFIELQLEKQLGKTTRQVRPEVAERLRKLARRASAEGIAAALVAIATRGDSSASLSSIRVPTAVVVGAEDTITPPALAEELASSIPEATLTVLPAAGHIANLEAPDEFDHALAALLSRVG